MEDYEILEWSEDPEWLKKRGRRFETTNPVDYVRYQFREYQEDMRDYERNLDDYERWSVLLYKKGYLIPYSWIKRRDGDKEFGALYKTRAKNINDRMMMRKTVMKELKRWGKTYDTTVPIIKRMIISVRSEEVIEEIVKWICRKAQLDEVYMYNCIGSRVGMKYYSGEKVIVMFIEEGVGWNRIKERKQVLENMPDRKIVIVIDKSGKMKMEGYETVNLTIKKCSQEILDTLGELDVIHI